MGTRPSPPLVRVFLNPSWISPERAGIRLVIWGRLAKDGGRANELVLDCRNKRYMVRRVRARGLHRVCRPRALTRRYRELLQAGT
jgi:hypothetical protein